ncbi:hypothetical protein ADUPG1_005168, partial [Aduncisulcus paluster]
MTPINENDTATQPFKLTSLDLSDNSISDVSVLITSDLFPADTLTTLDISGNSICNIDNVVSALQTKFTNLSSVTYSDQTCHCSASVSSSSFQVCREVYPDRWAVECWNGYYLDKTTGSCVEASTEVASVRCQVCEQHSNMMAVLESEASSITCGCRTAWYGDECDQLFQIYIPDYNMRNAICDAFVSGSESLCDISEFEMAEIVGEVNGDSSLITTLEKAQNLINVSRLSFADNKLSSLVPSSGLSQITKLDVSSSNSALYPMEIDDISLLS